MYLLIILGTEVFPLCVPMRLQLACTSSEQETEHYVSSKVRELIDYPFSRSHKERLDLIIQVTVERDQLTGQIIQNDDQVCLVSLIVRDS